MKKFTYLIYTFLFILVFCGFSNNKVHYTEDKNTIEFKSTEPHLDEYINRGYSAEILVGTNLFGHNRFCINPFADITPVNQYYYSILTLYRLGIYNGVESPDTQLIFAYPEQYLTREQAACLITNAFDLIGDSSSLKDIEEPTDLNKISEYAKQSVLICLKNKIICVDENNNFSPNNLITIQEYCNMISTALCLNNNNFNKSIVSTFNQKDLSQQIYISLNKSEVTINDALLLTLYNNSNEIYVCGEDFQLEIFKNGKWFLVPITKGGIDDVGLIIRANDCNQQTLYLKNYFDNLESGHYRIIKIVSPEFYNKNSFNNTFCAQEFDLIN